MDKARLQSLEEALKQIALPPGIDFYDACGQRVFPRMKPGFYPPSGGISLSRPPESDSMSEACVYIFRRGKKGIYPRLFDGGVMELGFHALEHGWAYLGHLVPENMTAIEMVRSIEANIPALVGLCNA